MLANCQDKLAELYLKQENLEATIELSSACIKTYENIKPVSKENIVRMNHWGNWLITQHVPKKNWVSIIEIASVLIRSFEAIEEKSDEVWSILAWIYKNIATVNLRQNNRAGAKESFGASLQCSENIKEKSNQVLVSRAKCLGSLVQIYYEEKNFVEVIRAGFSAIKALEIIQKGALPPDLSFERQYFRLQDACNHEIRNNLFKGNWVEGKKILSQFLQFHVANFELIDLNQAGAIPSLKFEEADLMFKIMPVLEVSFNIYILILRIFQTHFTEYYSVKFWANINEILQTPLFECDFSLHDALILLCKALEKAAATKQSNFINPKFKLEFNKEEVLKELALKIQTFKNLQADNLTLDKVIIHSLLQLVQEKDKVIENQKIQLEKLERALKEGSSELKRNREDEKELQETNEKKIKVSDNSNVIFNTNPVPTSDESGIPPLTPGNPN